MDPREAHAGHRATRGSRNIANSSTVAFLGLHEAGCLLTNSVHSARSASKGLGQTQRSACVGYRSMLPDRLPSGQRCRVFSWLGSDLGEQQQRQPQQGMGVSNGMAQAHAHSRPTHRTNTNRVSLRLFRCRRSIPGTVLGPVVSTHAPSHPHKSVTAIRPPLDGGGFERRQEAECRIVYDGMPRKCGQHGWEKCHILSGLGKTMAGEQASNASGGLRLMANHLQEGLKSDSSGTSTTLARAHDSKATYSYFTLCGCT